MGSHTDECWGYIEAQIDCLCNAKPMWKYPDETAWSILFWNHANDVKSLVKVHREYSHREYSPVGRILHTKFD